MNNETMRIKDVRRKCRRNKEIEIVKINIDNYTRE